MRELLGRGVYRVVFLVLFFAFCGVSAGGRRIQVGQKAPEFSTTDTDGSVFKFEHGQGKANLLLFLKFGQKKSELAFKDIDEVVRKLDGGEIRVLVILDDPSSGVDLTPGSHLSKIDHKLLIDPDYKIWGKFGIIVFPSTVIVGKDDVVISVKAGYGYDFIHSTLINSKIALGILDPSAAESIKQVTVLGNRGKKDKTNRHLKMARMLMSKGRNEYAVQEFEKARGIDPNNIEIALELGELYCQMGQADKAIGSVFELSVDRKSDRAKRSFILGWAYRVKGDPVQAKKLLEEAIRDDPRLVRGHYELGRVFEDEGELGKAVAAYRKALELLLEK